MNLERKHFATYWLIALLFGLLALLPVAASAGVYDEDTSTTYKEYWVSHSEFTGGNLQNPVTAVCEVSRLNGTFYIEPSKTCATTLDFNLPDRPSSAIKAEIYLDIWRGYESHSIAFCFGENCRGSQVRTQYRVNAGRDWSRTPVAIEIPTSELAQGANKITFWKETNAYHVHDIAIRLYYDNANPLDPGTGSDVTAPTAQLTTIQATGSSPVAANAGGTLNIDNDQIIISADNVAGDPMYIEFFALYDGYDEDLDGNSRDWHGRTRLNCHPGGQTDATPNLNSTGCKTDPNSTGSNSGRLFGTIDHIGTVYVDGNPPYQATWNIPHVTGQSDVRFKIRVVDAAGNARDAADVSASFTLTRNNAVTTFMIPNFKDIGIGDPIFKKPSSDERTITLPPDVETYSEAYVVGSYWRNPALKINGNPDPNGVPVFSNSEDSWSLSIKKVTNFSYLKSGENLLTYLVNGDGALIEAPGPMVVLRRTGGSGVDNLEPWIHREFPADGAISVPLDTDIEVQVYDSQSGVNLNSIKLFIDNVEVTPLQITGDQYNYKVRYNPPAPFGEAQTVAVRVEAEDNGARPSTKTFSFTTKRPFFPAAITSDDYNACTLNTDLWTVTDPIGDSTVAVKDNRLEITVPVPSALDKDHNLWNRNNNRAPRVMQPTDDGSFVVEVKFDSTFGPTGTQMQGLILGQNTSSTTAANFVRYNTERASNGDLRVYLAAFKDSEVDNSTIEFTKFTGITDPPPYLRVTRNIDDWVFEYSFDGSEWFVLTQWDAYPVTVLEVGVFAGNATGTSAPAHTAIVDYFFNSASPIVPEDGNALSLTVIENPDEGGNITKTPQCGNPTELTATVEPGWTFGGYSTTITTTGHITPVTDTKYQFKFGVTDVVTGTFLREYYTIDTHVVDETGAPHAQGQINKSAPGDPQGYIYQEQATLTAVANPGWTFEGWSGDLTGTTNPATLSMTGSKVVTATITQDHYAVTVRAVDGNGQTTTKGTATRSAPADAQGFVYGETATMTATAQAGWTFQGWESSTGKTSTDNPYSLVITDTQTIDAVFTEDRYSLTVTIVDEADNPADAGIVTLNPPNTGGYVYDTEVAVTIAPKEGWLFSHWSGDLTGTATAQEVNVTRDLAATAHFTKLYSVGLTLVHIDGGGNVTTTLSGGSVTQSPPANGIGYVKGEEVTFTATPLAGWTFEGWSGGLSGTTSPAPLTVSDDVTVTATFKQNTYQITTSAVGGSVQVKHADPQIMRNYYILNDIVDVTAVPDRCNAFVEWTGDLSGSNVVERFTLTGDTAITANFKPAVYTLDVKIEGEGTVAFVGSTPQPTYPCEAKVTLEAKPKTDWNFVGWNGTIGTSENPLEVTMDSNKTVTAIFSQNVYSLTIISEHGTVTRFPDFNGYPIGTEISLTVVPTDGWKFTHWSGDASGTDTTTKITVTGNMTVTANYEQGAVKGELKYTIQGQGAVEVEPNKETYVEGEEVTLKALPATGWRFVRWEIPDGALVTGQSKDSPNVMVKITTGTTFIAIFEQAMQFIHLPLIRR